MKPIAVLGTGPSGLAAAHAVALSGHPVALFGIANNEGIVKSRPSGAQFLHREIPFASGAPGKLCYRLEGTPEGYQRKSYGDNPDVPFVSFANVHDRQEVDCWNLLETYDNLWEMLSADRANAAIVNSEWLDREAHHFDLIISSIPAHAMCHGGHDFKTSTTYIAEECVLEDSLEDMTILYDGSPERSWHRTSLLWGVGGTEYGSHERITPGMDVTAVQKPLHTNCDCHPEVLRVGRLGKWSKGELVDAAFYEVAEFLS